MDFLRVRLPFLVSFPHLQLCIICAGRLREKATQAWKSSAQMEKATWAGGPGEVARGARSRAERDDVHEMGGLHLSLNGGRPLFSGGASLPPRWIGHSFTHPRATGEKPTVRNGPSSFMGRPEYFARIASE